ncbi:hypothetical protein EJ110_NYTH40274 [Nymphaea thermarum]|nr:hypothetical protein EJ110_NYTH40274 [Nymphaea thermarum]
MRRRAAQSLPINPHPPAPELNPAVRCRRATILTVAPPSPAPWKLRHTNYLWSSDPVGLRRDPLWLVAISQLVSFRPSTTDAPAVVEGLTDSMECQMGRELDENAPRSCHAKERSWVEDLPPLVVEQNRMVPTAPSWASMVSRNGDFLEECEPELQTREENGEAHLFVSKKVGIFLVRASSEDDILAITEPEKWKIGGWFLITNRWKSGSPLKVDAKNKVCLWIRLHDFLIRAYLEPVLHTLAPPPKALIFVVRLTFVFMSFAKNKREQLQARVKTLGREAKLPKASKAFSREGGVFSCEVNSRAWVYLKWSGRRVPNPCEVRNARFEEDLGYIDLGDLEPSCLGAEDLGMLGLEDEGLGAPSLDEEDPGTPNVEGEDLGDSSIEEGGLGMKRSDGPPSATMDQREETSGSGSSKIQEEDPKDSHMGIRDPRRIHTHEMKDRSKNMRLKTSFGIRKEHPRLFYYFV